jgi:glycine cleavage system H protein
MTKWKDVRVKQELVEEIEKEVQKESEQGQIQSLSEFVSEAIHQRLQELAKERVPEYMERDEQSRILEPKAELYYTPKHMWVKATAQGRLRIGISEYFGKHLKGIVFVDAAKEGESVHKDEPFGTVETVARWPLVIHDLYSPTEGKIVRINKEVLDDPYLLNGDPFQWIVEIEPSDPEFDEKLGELLNLEEYTKLINRLEQKPYSPPTDSELNEMIQDIKQ